MLPFHPACIFVGDKERKRMLKWTLQNLYAKQEFQHITKQVKEEMSLKERFIHSFYYKRNT